MGKRVRTWNEEHYRKWLNQGRGKGDGRGYRPWISVQDFSSRGTASRVLGWKTGRVHHFLSNNELRYFYLLEWSDCVLDIREQYPLIDVFVAKDIAGKAGIRYPTDRCSGFPYVLTTDFLITTTQGLVARTIKLSSELNNARVVEKLEIERRYWKAMGVNWGLVTERDIPLQTVQNIQWLHSSKYLNGLDLEPYQVEVALRSLEEGYLTTEQSVLELCEKLDRDHKMKGGTSLKLFKYLAANKKVAI